jgi:3-hydroxymyristoyl/3-hydroxydecanoyl-(acyl carrier protein) dehydratase
MTLRREIASDHPAFAGHFPGRPLLPGALLLAEVLEALLGVPALAARLGPQPTLDAAKFLAPVPPGASLVIIVQDGPRSLRFEVHHGAVLAASGQWRAAPAGEAPVDAASPDGAAPGGAAA